MDHLPVEVIDLIAVHIQAPIFDDYNDEWHFSNNDWRKDLRSIRLVNSWLASALRSLLFQDVTVRLYFNHRSAPDRLAKLLQLSRSHIAPCVRRLKIRLHFSVPGPQRIEVVDQNSKIVFFQDLARILPLCVQSFPNLHSLNMLSPRGSVAYHEEIIVPSEVYRLVNSMIARTLTLAKLNVVNLSLQVPCTSTINDILRCDANGLSSRCQIPLRETLSRLKQLSITLCDNSGPDGQRQFHRHSSKLLRFFGSQEKYAKNMFDFVQMATNLDLLSISCTTPLNLDLLASGQIRTLIDLSLDRVEVGGRNFLKLLSRNSSTLEWVRLSQVELKSSTWEGVLTECGSFQHLLLMELDSCGYSPEGESFEYHKPFLSGHSIHQSIEGNHARDGYALGDLTRLINERRVRKGLSEVSENEEPTVDWPSLASVDQLFDQEQ